MQYTKEDVAKWLADHIERRENPPLAETLQQIHERTKDNTPLQSRVKIFLHRVDNFAVPLTEAFEGYSHTDRLYAYHLVKGWCSTLVGWDAPSSEYVEGGFDVLMDWVIDRLGV
jgi:hypothetical protein